MVPYPWDKLFINVIFFPLNKQSPLIIKDCSSQIALVWFNLPLAVIIWVIPREENTESTPGCAAAGLILLQYCGSDSLVGLFLMGSVHVIPEVFRTCKPFQSEVCEQFSSY